MQPPRSSVNHGKVLLGLFVLFALFVAGMWLAYTQLVQYERRAAWHVPDQSTFAARIDLEQVVLFEPVRRHLFPVLRSKLEKSGGFERLEAATGIDLAMDLRELLFARAADGQGWVIAVGGLFPDAGVIEGLHQIVVESGVTGCALIGVRMSCQAHAIHAEQAEDGVVLFASDAQLLERALVPSAHFERLGLGLASAAGFGLDGRSLRELAPVRYASLVPGLGALSQFDGASGQVSLGTDTFVEFELRPVEGGNVTELVPVVERLLAAFGALIKLASLRDHAGEQALIARAEVTATEHGSVRVRSLWPREDIDRAAASLAELLATWLSSASSR